MAHIETRALRPENVSQFAVSTARDSVAPGSDDGFDFPPTTYPGRELFTASVFVLMIMTLVVWGGWKLITLM
jgi:hypothetical protein